MNRVVGVAVVAAAAVAVGLFAGQEWGLPERAVRVGQANDGAVKLTSRLLHREGEPFYYLSSRITNLSGAEIWLHYACTSHVGITEIPDGEICHDVMGATIGPGKSLEEQRPIPAPEVEGRELLTARLAYAGSTGDHLLEAPLQPAGRLPLGWMAVGVGVASLMALMLRRSRRRPG